MKWLDDVLVVLGFGMIGVECYDSSETVARVMVEVFVYLGGAA